MIEPNLVRRAVIALVGVAVLLTIVGIAGNAEQFSTGTSRRTATANLQAQSGEFTAPGIRVSESDNTSPSPVRLPRAVGYVLAGMTAAVCLYFLSRQRFSFDRGRRSGITRPEQIMSEEEEAEAIVAIVYDLIDELGAGDDPRHAIQRAYAAVETGFGASEFARKPAETPLKYLGRVFGKHKAAAQPLERLTDLFQIARFSELPVDESMRSTAIESLAEIRDHYQARVPAGGRART